jgi:hypothetical protein
MQILGYICQFPAHKPTSKKGSMNSGFADTMAADVSDGTVIGCVALKNVPNVSWPTYLLNVMHMQINCFLVLQCNGFNWMLHYKWKGLSHCTAPVLPIHYWRY